MACYQVRSWDLRKSSFEEYVFCPRFEPGISRIQIRNSTTSVKFHGEMTCEGFERFHAETRMFRVVFLGAFQLLQPTADGTK